MPAKSLEVTFGSRHTLGLEKTGIDRGVLNVGVESLTLDDGREIGKVLHSHMRAIVGRHEGRNSFRQVVVKVGRVPCVLAQSGLILVHFMSAPVRNRPR
jgi:hypothetical protein